MEKKYLKTSEIFSFSSSAFGRSMIYNLMSTFLLIFYTDAMQLEFKHAGAIILFTSKGDFTEHFYHKQNMKSNPQMIFMEKEI